MRVIGARPTGRLSLTATGILGTLLWPVADASAHHGTGASYDRSSPVEIAGVVREFVWRNPHSRLFFDVEDAHGNIVSWGAEMTSPTRLSRLGWSRTTLEPGDRIELTLYPSRAGTTVGEVVRDAPFLINGTPAPSTDPRDAVPPPVAAEAAASPHDPRDLDGVWGPYSGPRRTVVGDAPPVMTSAGRAKFEAQLPSYGPRSVPPALGNDPIGGCNPMGVTRSLLFERPFEIIQRPGRIVQMFEWTRFWRDIWTDGRAMPPEHDPLWLGYSIGRWDGDTFVVTTTHFDDRTWLDQLGYPHSDALRLIERYRRTDSETLVLDMTIEDAVMYAAPIEVPTKTFRLQHAPEYREEFCAPLDEGSFNRRIRDPAGGLSATDN